MTAPPAVDLAVDIDAVVRFCRTLHEPEDVLELRAVEVVNRASRHSHVVSGYFQRPEDLATAAASLVKTADKVAGLYIIGNRIDARCLPRAANRLADPAVKTTSAADVQRRRVLAVDLDPLRPAGISSSDQEHLAAFERANDITKDLRRLGWPKPLALDSGNGAWLLYRIDEPNDAPTKTLIERVLRALDWRYGDDLIGIDQSLSNADRLVRLVGTPNAKGDHVPDRPHRLAVLKSAPDPFVPVTRQQLQALADSLPDVDAASRERRVPSTAFNVQAWLDRYLPDAAPPRAWQGGSLWQLTDCPFGGVDHHNTARVTQLSSGALSFGCFHNSCQQYGWADLREMFEPDYHDRRNGSAGVLGGEIVTRPSEGLSSPISHSSIPWPKPVEDAALHGWIGKYIRAVEPHTEADRAALLAHAISGVGALVGSNVYAVAGDAPHPARLYTVVVGETSKGRKGSSARPMQRVLRLTDDSFGNRIVEGASSGEGLIWQVRDQIEKYERPKDGGESRLVVVDPGISDKRLWDMESEFASVLRVAQREGNTLTAIVRRAWDSGDIRTLTKNSPAVATGAHIVLTGHVTKDELLRYLDRTELASGFANRFCWFAAKRARILPHGESVPEEELRTLADELRKIQAWARDSYPIHWNEEAALVWESVYERLSDGQPGLFGAATSRAEAQVLRLSVLYAILDRSKAMCSEHLLAAVAVWDYAQASARWIFGDATGDPVADTILTALRQSGPLDRTDIRDLFHRHAAAGRIDQALGLLLKASLARPEHDRTEGRNREVWHAV